LHLAVLEVVYLVALWLSFICNNGVSLSAFCLVESIDEICIAVETSLRVRSDKLSIRYKTVLCDFMGSVM